MRGGNIANTHCKSDDEFYALVLVFVAFATFLQKLRKLPVVPVGHPGGRPLEHCQRLDPVSDLGNDLHPRGARADDGHVFAGYVVVLGPLGSVEACARKGRFPWDKKVVK